MKTTHLRNLLIAVFCLLGFGQAQAQYSKTVELRDGKFFKIVPAEFSLNAVATTLGTDAATLAADFTKWKEPTEETPWEGDELLFLTDPVNGEVCEYTEGNHGFFLTKDGGLANWNVDGLWYAYPIVDAENDLFAFEIGASNALPEGIEPLKQGDQVTCNLIFKYNDKQATFALTLKIIEPATLPTPATIVESELNVVGTKQITVEQYPRTGWDSDAVTIVLDDIVEKLGADVDLLSDELAPLLYCTEYNNAETVADGQGLKKAELSNHSTAGEPGFWLAAIMDEGGEFTGECSSVAYDGGVERKFFIEQFAFNAETNELTCRLGQEPNALTKDDAYFVNIYIIYGDKAYRVRYDFKLKEREAGTGMDAYNKVGEEEVVVEQVINTSYITTPLNPNLDAIAEVLGCEVSDLKVRALDSSQNFAASNTNADGYWFDVEGVVTAWATSTSAFWVDFSLSDLANTFEVGQHERNVLKAGDQASANLYFMYSEDPGTNYYLYKVTLKVIAEAMPENAFESVASRTINAQTLITTDYSCTQEKQIDVAEVAALIGTDSPTLYGWAMDENIVEAVNGEYSKAYSCDPKPGFYLTEEGRVSTWGDGNTKVGISYLADGTFRFFQKPNTHAVGDVFKCQLFLVNEETGDMVTCNIKLKFVDEIGPDDEDAEIVGEVSNVLIPLHTEKSVPFNLNLAAEALGVTIDDLMDMNCLRGGTNGEFGTLVALTDGISYNSETFEYDPAGDIYLVFDQNGDEVEVTVMGIEVADDFSKNIDFCIEVEGKRFIYHAKLVSLQAYVTGIESISNGQMGNGTLYDLSGRQVAKAQKGIYIQNGKRFVVK